MNVGGAGVSIPPLDRVLREHGLDGLPEEPFPNDGWSGASLTRLRRGGGDRFILKRDSLARDWIAKATNDGPLLREAWFANRRRILDEPTGGNLRASYLGAGQDGETFGLLMPDLTGVLFDWEKPIPIEALDRVLEGIARVHAGSWSLVTDGPWCPIRERITLICRSSLERPGPANDAVADRILPGWDAFDRRASRSAHDLVAMLSDDPQPLVDVLSAQESTLIHGDLKLANVGIAADGAVETIDWQMVSIGPIAIELGWFLVANVAALPLGPDEVLARYQGHLDAASLARDGGEWLDQDVWLDQPGIDAAILVGLLLRGWRKGLDADGGITLGSGVTARDDLAWWCDRAVEAADRIL